MRPKGFTLIELMIVVAIIGILSSVAIPNFMRYQLRSKSSEGSINLNALFKAQTSLKSTEVKLCADAPQGGYFQFAAPIPANCEAIITGGGATGRMDWTTVDIREASKLGWIVQGATYHCYDAVVTAPTASSCGDFGNTVSLAASSDIDGDGIAACTGVWQPLLQSGVPVTLPPDAPCHPMTPPVLHPFAWAVGDPVGQTVPIAMDFLF